MGQVVILAGATGTGKSTSIRNLDTKETYVINVLGKRLPFEGSTIKYNEGNKNIASVANYNEVKSIVKAISEQRKEVKNLIIDDIGFVMTTEFFSRVLEKGYEKFTEIGLHMQQIIQAGKDSRDDLKVVLLFHEDFDYNEKTRINKKVKTIGALLDDKYDPLAVVSVALFTDVVFDKDGKATYNFLTSRTMVDRVLVPAKSPEGMFKELRIPNDLKMVFDRMDEYYGSTLVKQLETVN